MLLRSVALAFVAGLLAAPAMAADTVRPAPIVAAPFVQPGNPFDGFYLGGNAGYGTGTRSGCFDIGFPPSCSGTDFKYSQKGWLAGGQVGVNHVLGGGGLLLGAEVSADLSGITGNLAHKGPFSGVGDYSWLALAEAKVGITHGNWLFYGQGGVALGSFSYASTLCSFTSNNQGWAYGAGASVAMGKNALFIDYNHINFNAKDASCGLGFLPFSVKTKPTLDVVRVGFNHYFN
jgi:outer membrane immunogenic protein